VEKILLKSLAKKPEDRNENIVVFASALEGLLTGQGVTAQPAESSKPVPPPA
jgi:hypothetical protein